MEIDKALGGKGGGLSDDGCFFVEFTNGRFDHRFPCFNSAANPNKIPRPKDALLEAKQNVIAAN